MDDHNAALSRIEQAMNLLNEIIVGQRDTISLIICCLLAKGHVLLEDLPGSGKTTLAKAIAAVLALELRRVQGTADLLPTDIIGFSVFDEDTKKFSFHKGPLFTQLLLADEINRASPKSQSALLEAMEEGQVTTEQQTHLLPQPFFVIATQNPLEQIGTFSLPESQLDRFMMRLSLGYPQAAQEIEVLRAPPRCEMINKIKPLITKNDLLILQKMTTQITISRAIAEYVQKIMAQSRRDDNFICGLSTRAGLSLLHAAQALALLSGSSGVLPAHVQKVFPAIAWHRLRARITQAEHGALLQKLLDSVEIKIN